MFCFRIAVTIQALLLIVYEVFIVQMISRDAIGFF